MLSFHRAGKPLLGPLKPVANIFGYALRAWQTSVGLYAVLAGLALVINVILTIWLSVSFPSVNGITNIMEGDCSRVSNWDTWIHLAINVLSILLLSGSSYTMQCLVAPTRQEIDRAHAAGSWLDIGVPSVRNLWFIDRRRTIAWALLAMSSVPLAFFYNSAVFKAIGSNDYNLLVVDETFLNGSQAIAGTDVRDSGNMTTLCYPGEAGPELTCVDGFDEKSQRLTEKLHEQVGDIQNRSTSFQVLNNKQCIDEYSQSLHSGRRHLLAITRQRTEIPLHYNTTNADEITDQRPSPYNITYANTSNPNYEPFAGYNEKDLAGVCSDYGTPCLRILEGSLINFWSLNTTSPNFREDNQTYDSSDWMCSFDSGPMFDQMWDSCVPNSLDPNDWRVNAQPIEYCRSEIVEEQCRLEFSTTIGIIVAICNAVKLAVLAFTAVRLDQRTLCTIGDTMASFLDEQVEPLLWQSTVSLSHPPSNRKDKGGVYQRLDSLRENATYWIEAPNLYRSCALAFMSLGMLAASSALLVMGTKHLRALSYSTSLRSLWSYGFGQVTSSTLININRSRAALMSVVLLANLPQALLSICYLLYNGAFTCMLMEQEFQAYARRPRRLRVSLPVYDQRSTYYLQLPFRFAIPLIMASGLMHWLISQSLFIAHILSYNSKGMRNLRNDVITCGYSPIAIICSIATGALMVIAIILVSFRKYEPGLPLAKNRSSTIQAACFRVPEDIKAATSPVMWGVVKEENGFSLYGFSSCDLRHPVSLSQKV